MPLQEPPYSSKAVSNFFLAKSRAITQLKLHKLLYYAHGWHLGLTSAPLLDEMVEAWQHGPIVPSVYHEFITCGTRPINHFAVDLNPYSHTLYVVRPPTDNPYVINVLEQIWKVYNEFSVPQLDQLVRVKDSPWLITRDKHPGIKGVDIPNSLLAEHFAEKVRENAR